MNKFLALLCVGTALVLSHATATASTVIVVTSADPDAYFGTATLLGPLAVPGALQSLAQFINNHNHIVLQWQDPQFQFHSSVYFGPGKFVLIDVPGSSSTNASGLNDRGVIVGAFIPVGGSAEEGFEAVIRK